MGSRRKRATEGYPTNSIAAPAVTVGADVARPSASPSFATQTPPLLTKGRQAAAGLLAELGLGLFEGAGKLVGTGRGLHAAADAAHARDDIVDVHALDKAADALQVAIAAAGEDDVLDLAAVEDDVDVAGAGALGTIIKFYGKIPFYSVRSQTVQFT